jgi:hypothetical protein
VEFSYRLTGVGWAEATITCGDRSATLTASYMSDALAELLLAVGELADGADAARCSWEEEPGEFRWLFARAGEDVDLRILWFDDIYAEGEYLGEASFPAIPNKPELARVRPVYELLVSAAPDLDGGIVFECQLTLSELVSAIAEGASAVLAKYGHKRYRKKWASKPFPDEPLAALQRWLADESSADGTV